MQNIFVSQRDKSHFIFAEIILLLLPFLVREFNVTSANLSISIYKSCKKKLPHSIMSQTISFNKGQLSNYQSRNITGSVNNSHQSQFVNWDRLFKDQLIWLNQYHIATLVLHLDVIAKAAAIFSFAPHSRYGDREPYTHAPCIRIVLL